MSSLTSKINLIKTKIDMGEYENALKLLDDIFSTGLSQANMFEKIRIVIINKIFEQLIAKSKYDEAINKIGIYKSKYNKDFKDIEFSIYFNLAEKEFKEEKIDASLAHFEKSLTLKPNNKGCQFWIITILIVKKSLYEKALIKINELEKNISKEDINSLNELKALALNNLAINKYKNNLEECLNLLNQAIELDQKDVYKENRFIKFKIFYVKKIEMNKYNEIPSLFKKTLNYKYLSKKMEDYLNINKYISNYFEGIYLSKDKTITKFKKSLKYLLTYIRVGLKEEDFDAKSHILFQNFFENLEENYNSFIKYDIAPNKFRFTNTLKKEKKLIITNNINDINQLEIYKELINEINNYIQKYKDINQYKELKSLLIFKLGNIYLEKENNYKLSKELYLEFLKTKKGENLDKLQVQAYLNLGIIELEEQKYLESFESQENLINLINKKYNEKEHLDFPWPNEILTMKINSIKIQALIKYIEIKLEEIEFINLDNYLKILIDLMEQSKDIESIEEIEDKLKFFQIEYLRKKLIYLMEINDYQKCLELCNEFLQTNQSNNYIIREIKQLKLNCLKELSDNLIKENKKEEFIEKVKEISLLQKDIDSELGINKTNEDLINIMSKVINEKAEYFNRNNFCDVSENISDLGLQFDPNNIDLLTEKSISNLIIYSIR